MKNVLEWLEATEEKKDHKSVYMDRDGAISFSSLMQKAKAVGTFLKKTVNSENEQAPIAVLCDRCCQTPAAFLGVVYSGRPYAPLDVTQPIVRLQNIISMMKPAAILTDRAMADKVKEILIYSAVAEAQEEANPFTSIPVYVMEEIDQTEHEDDLLTAVRNRMVSTDPLYIIYTSGSTGMPKGVITSHDSLIRYIDAYAKVMGIDEEDRLGNQSPLDYIAAIRDIYLPLKTGCSSVIIPKEYFMEPYKLFEYMNQFGVTSVGWSVSAFTIAVSLGAFEEACPSTLKKICFSGSVMPAKTLRTWQDHLPETLFVNQYGPTEATASCTYYVVDHVVEDGEVLPIGTPYDNYQVFILKEDDTLAMPGEEGEICIAGPCLALGYYNDPERTAASFIQNPVNTSYQQRIYRSGDIGIQREDGVFEFHGRKDRQIKHMGHRVELDEIEVAANRVDGVGECCCIYQKEKEKLHLFYSGDADKKTLIMELRQVLPGFMVPRGVKQLEALPKLANGKIDMNALKAMTGRRRS